ncbi:MAG: exo-alpha-sialidase [Prevotellaceae bacterium]|jgi:photosystem II stability/assembly factor-like uncharacterized protein|nr:exo-alpha-sialidase [Prevotellaceae bacterium]
MKTVDRLILCLLFVSTTAMAQTGGRMAALESVPSQPYEWKSVQIVGGGFVDGIVFHPNAKDVRYCRTDMGGAYRWDATAKRWVAMLDWISYDDNNLVGVESIAVDPNDPNTVYLSCGTYTRSPNGAIMISNDGGRSFKRVDMPFTMGGNENGRGNGERMMVDPNNSNVIYIGTRLDGLWRSTDKGISWEKVTSFPDVTERFDTSDRRAMMNRGCGVVTVVFDPTSGTSGQGSQTIYVAVSLMNQENMFVSRDGGKTWSTVAGHPQAYRPTHAILSSEGILYVTYGTNPGPNRMENGGVWKYDTKSGKWTEISPVKPNPEADERFGYAAVSVDKNDPKHIIVSTFNRPLQGKHTEDDIFHSTDGGKTWKGIFAGKTEMDYTNAPYVQFTPLHWMFDIEIDPYDANHAIFTTGYGGWETFNLTDVTKRNGTVRWQIMSTGIEETVPLAFYSPKRGAQQLHTAIGDYGSFTHIDLDKPVPTGSDANPYFANTTSIAGADDVQGLVVRVGTVSAHHPEGKPLAWSEDGGASWKMPAVIPGERSSNGYICVSPNGQTWIWSPSRNPVFRTTDKGNSWTEVKGLPNGIQVIADKVNTSRFYAIDVPTGVFYESKDGGLTFAADTILQPLRQPGARMQTPLNRGDNRGGQDHIYATDGHEGDLWIAAYDGLYRYKGGQLQKQAKVRQIIAFGMGKGKPGVDYPALYLAGIINGVHGVVRSDDAAKTWVRVNDDDHHYGLILQLSGDPKKYGRVYLGTHGRGALYADPK